MSIQYTVFLGFLTSSPIQGNWDIWHISPVSANYICTEHKAMLAPGHQSKLLLALQESKRPNWRRHRVCLHRLRCSVASIFTYFHGPWFALQPQRKRRLNRTSSEWEESPCSPAQKINIINMFHLFKGEFIQWFHVNYTPNGSWWLCLILPIT